jgi:hypothetical protein
MIWDCNIEVGGIVMGLIGGSGGGIHVLTERPVD